jgi:hypothetical protein
MGLGILTAFAVLIGQAGAPLSQAMCQIQEMACCCAPQKPAPTDCHAPQKSIPCPMMLQAESAKAALIPTKISTADELPIYGDVLLPTDQASTPSLKLAPELTFAPPGPAPHRLPSLRAPPALA